MKPSELQKIFEYNPDTGILTYKYRPDKSSSWNTQWAGKVSGALNEAGYIKITIDNKRYYAHRIAFAIYYGEWPDLFIDHIDGNKSNNKISNLRQANKSQNGCNRVAPKHNTSGYKGVCLDKRRNKWRANIRLSGKQVWLGYYDTPEKAYLAYCEGAKTHYGEFARL